MQLTKKIRVFPTPDQEEVLCYLSERCRLLYNFALAERRKEWELNNLKDDFDVFPWGKTSYSVDYKKQQNDLPNLKEKYPKYKAVYSKVLQMAIRTLNADYNSFFEQRKNGDTNAHPPGFKGKEHFTTMIHNQSGFRIKSSTITLTQYYKKDIPLTFDIPSSEKFRRVYQVSIFKDKNKYFLSIVHEVPEKPYEDNGIYQAIDLGITKTVSAVNTKGKFFEAKNPRPDKYWNQIIDALQSRRDHCKKKSRKHNHIHQSMTKRQKKRSNQIKDIQHKLSRRMIDNTRANTIIIGDLDVKEMAQSRKATKGLNKKKSLNQLNSIYSIMNIKIVICFIIISFLPVASLGATEKVWSAKSSGFIKIDESLDFENYHVKVTALNNTNSTLIVYKDSGLIEKKEFQVNEFKKYDDIGITLLGIIGDDSWIAFSRLENKDIWIPSGRTILKWGDTYSFEDYSIGIEAIGKDSVNLTVSRNKKTVNTDVFTKNGSKNYDNLRIVVMDINRTGFIDIEFFKYKIPTIKAKIITDKDEYFPMKTFPY